MEGLKQLHPIIFSVNLPGVHAWLSTQLYGKGLRNGIQEPVGSA